MLVLSILLTVAALVFVQIIFKRRRLPPGPFPLPLFGNIPYLAYLTHVHGGIVPALQFLKIVSKYGPVFTVWFGPLPTVHIADFTIAQDAMIKHGNNYADRWVPLLLSLPRNGLGIIVSNGKHWLDHRRFSLHTLRNFGFGKNIIEEKIMEEFNLKFDEVDQQIRKTGSHVIDPSTLIEVLVGSIINRILFSERFHTSSDHFFALKRSVDKTLNRLSFMDVFIHKSMLYLPFIGKRYANMLAPFYQLKDYLRQQINQRKADIQEGRHVLENEASDYVDAYFIKMAEEAKENKETSFTEEALLVNLLDLWIAGQETTTTTILSGLINLINHPKVMDKVRAEIKQVTGNNRALSLTDRPSTPYLLATITEIQRLASILNLNLWRRAVKDAFVGGFPVTAGTVITAQLSLLLSDLEVFENSASFDPSRYLKTNRIDHHVIPFGIGKRACLGESLARAELYLIIGNLIQRYDISAVGDLPSKEPRTTVGVLRRPRDFLLSLTRIP